MPHSRGRSRRLQLDSEYLRHPLADEDVNASRSADMSWMYVQSTGGIRLAMTTERKMNNSVDMLRLMDGWMYLGSILMTFFLAAAQQRPGGVYRGRTYTHGILQYKFLIGRFSARDDDTLPSGSGTT